MAFDFGSLIGPALGGLFGGGDDTQTQTSTSEPWGPAQPFLLRNLKDTEALGNYYKKNPFNSQQIESYSNLVGDQRHLRDNVMPGLLDFANKGMTSNYQRATGGAMGRGAGYGGAERPAGLLSSGTGPFSMAQGAGPRATGTNSLLDLNNAQNPYQNGGVTQNPETVTEEMIGELKSYLESPGQDRDQTGGGAPMGNTAGWNMPEMPGFMSALSPALAAAYEKMRAMGIANGMGLTYGDGMGNGGGYGGEGVQGPGGYGTGDGGYGPQ